MNNQYIQKVEEFMTTFQQPVVAKPQEMPEDRNKLRIALIFEELSEYAEASGLSDYFSGLCIHSAAAFAKGPDTYYVPVIDLVEQFDALLDMQYVLSGAVIENGFKDIFDKGFDEVHRSNMSKTCSTKEEGLNTCVKYQKEGIQCTTHEVNNRFIVYRDEDNKVLKSINYSPANLLLIIEDAQRNSKPRGKGNVIKSTANVEIRDERHCGNTERIINNTIDFLFKGEAVAIIDHVDSRKTNQLLLLRTLRRLTLLGVYQRFSPNITTKVKVTYDSNLKYNILKLEDDTSKSNSR